MTATLSQYLLQFLKKNDPQKSARYIVAGRDVVEEFEKQLAALNAELEADGRLHLKCSPTSSTETDIIYLVTKSTKNPAAAEGHTLWWTTGLTAEELEIYQQFRADQMEATQALECAKNITQNQ